MTAALVTGAGKRIGRALAFSLARAGHDVYLHYRSSAPDTLVDDIVALGRRAVAVQADLADAGQSASLIARCTELGPVACLVNNAAVYEHDTAGDLTAEGIDRHHAVNLRAPLLLAQAFARQLPDGQAGLIVNMLDFHVAAPTPRFFSYGVSKSALAAATEMLAIALAPRIRVCGIAPGLVLPSPSESGERFDRLRAQTLLGRGPDIADIVAAFEYLLAASNVTGQIIHVDGGQRLISKRNPHV